MRSTPSPPLSMAEESKRALTFTGSHWGLAATRYG
jgi:hypothetical protein